ncbi:MAG: beta-lactamase family protein [Acidimicrobiia bacterium]|nr:beta-lactamase family protein [Acidimicrobiia bacterium]
MGLSRPRSFEPGTNWDYSHTNYVILGQVLERITGQPLVTLVRDRILRPLDLRNTRSAATGRSPAPRPPRVQLGTP